MKIVSIKNSHIIKSFINLWLYENIYIKMFNHVGHLFRMILKDTKLYICEQFSIKRVYFVVNL